MTDNLGNLVEISGLIVGCRGGGGVNNPGVGALPDRAIYSCQIVVSLINIGTAQFLIEAKQNFSTAMTSWKFGY